MDTQVKQTLLEMLNQRNYTDIEEIDDTITALKPDGEMIWVFLKIIKKLNSNEIENHIVLMQRENISHAILIHEGLPTPTAKKAILNLPTINIHIELFQVEDLMFNRTKHILVPKHVPLSGEETKNFIKNFGTDIPVILRTDPISRFYDFRKGQIIKIERKNGEIGFRIVK